MTLRPASSVPPVVSAVAARQSSQLTVGAYLPLADATFARVMNPVRSGPGSAVTWSAVAGEGVVVGATTPWNDVVEDAPRGVPMAGSIDPSLARSLARILRAHTTTPAECFFLVWEGYAGLRDDLLPAVHVEFAPGRSMLILSGDLSDGSEAVDGPPFFRTPQWWLPGDGAWAVGNDIYGTSVYVAGTEEAISAILADQDIEAYRAASSVQIIAEEF